MFDLTLAAFTFDFFINKVLLSEYYNKEREHTFRLHRKTIDSWKTTFLSYIICFKKT